MSAHDDKSPSHLHRAFDELRFGSSRTLNLRALQPTAMQATDLAERWLRFQQVQGASEALVITGRGNRSIEGFSPVREAIVKLLPSLRRRNVLSAYAEHTPGSFTVTFASVRALFEAPKRRREKTSPEKPITPASLAALDEQTRFALQDVAVAMLASLGVHAPSREMIDEEMCRQFAQISAALPPGPDKEALLQQAAQRALEEFELG